MQKPPAPYTDSQGNEYFNASQAAQIVRGVSVGTIRNWANAGETSFGFPLTVILDPIRHHRSLKTNEAPPEHPMQERKIILAADVYRLREILKEAGRTEPRPWNLEEMERLAEIARPQVPGHVRSHRQRFREPHT